MANLKTDQYKDSGTLPYQQVIDYVNQNDAVCFWSAPEAEKRIDEGPIKLHTRSYLQEVLRTRGHDTWQESPGGRVLITHRLRRIPGRVFRHRDDLRPAQRCLAWRRGLRWFRCDR